MKIINKIYTDRKWRAINTFISKHDKRLRCWWHIKPSSTLSRPPNQLEHKTELQKPHITLPSHITNLHQNHSLHSSSTEHSRKQTFKKATARTGTTLNTQSLRRKAKSWFYYFRMTHKLCIIFRFKLSNLEMVEFGFWASRTTTEWWVLRGVVNVCVCVLRLCQIWPELPAVWIHWWLRFVRCLLGVSIAVHWNKRHIRVYGLKRVHFGPIKWFRFDGIKNLINIAEYLNREWHLNGIKPKNVGKSIWIEI